MAETPHLASEILNTPEPYSFPPQFLIEQPEAQPSTSGLFGNIKQTHLSASAGIYAIR